MTAGQDEAIAVVPQGVLRIVFEMVSPELISHRGQGHRSAGVTAVGGLHSIHTQSSDGIDCQIAKGAR